MATLLGETAKYDQVAQGIEQEGIAFHPVPSGTADLLVVILDTPRHAVMHDPTDITLVDTHPESYRGAHHVHPVVDEIVLGLFPLGGQEAGVVGDRLDIIHRQLIGQLGRIVAAHAINDTALLPVPPDEMDDGGDLLFLVKPSAYREGDVRAVER